jgi:polar amino acid transport system substrate-binding protein
MKRFVCWLGWFCSAAWCGQISTQAWTQTAMPTPLVVQYSDRPPFMMLDSGGAMTGSVGGPAAHAFQMAGISVKWEASSSKRQLAILQADATPVCSIGWYKTTEREQYAKYTKAVSQDSAMVALANADFHAADNGRIEDLLSNPNISVLVKDAVVYGTYLDSQFGKMKARRVTSIDEYGPMVRLVRLGRVQLTFIPIEEANYYIEKMGYARSDFNIIHFSDMPPGERRYILCSKKVDDAVIEKLNAHINFGR